MRNKLILAVLMGGCVATFLLSVVTAAYATSSEEARRRTGGNSQTTVTGPIGCRVTGPDSVKCP